MARNVHPFPPQPEPWKAKLIVDKLGAPRPVFVNAAHALRDAPAWFDVLAFDNFAKRTMLMAPPPWEMFPNNWQPRPWTGQDDFQTTEWLQQQNILVPLSIAEHAVEMVATERRYHPVREYLDDIEWDGEPRLEQWMPKYLGVVDNEYTRTVSRCTLIGAVARISEPGCKVDDMPIFEGWQGIGKSTLAGAMFEPWFSDEIADLGSKDAAMQMQGVWMIEIAELDAMSRGEVSKIKAFVSRRTDRFRPPYGRRVVAFPRQCVFWGTTNSTGYLKDETGGRRFWPIKCGKIDVAGLYKVRDQLWAEADFMYQTRVAWWIVDPKVKRLAEAEQANRYQGDPWTDPVLEYMRKHTNNLDTATINDILFAALSVTTERQGQTEMNRVARILRANGYERYQHGSGNSRSWRYRRTFRQARPARPEPCEPALLLVRRAGCFIYAATDGRRRMAGRDD